MAESRDIASEFLKEGDEMSASEVQNTEDLVKGVEDQGVSAPVKTVENQAVQSSGHERKPGQDGETPIADGVDRLLQRHRNEIMFELRRLQHGERPVTGQSNRDAVESFFQQQISGETSDDHRPETVVVEVQGLVERRPVSSLLQSALFRRQLENTVRSSLANIQPAVNSVETSYLQRAREMSATPAPSAVETRNHSSVERSVSPASSAEPSVAAARPTPAARSSRPASRPTPATRSSIPQSTASSPARDVHQWVQQQPQDRVLPAWENIADIQRENLVAEISDLVHQQLVTSALESDFRQRMESHVQSRLLASGHNGEVVLETLQNLPRGRVQHNDFSHLGIMGTQETASLSDHLDNVSVISATAAVHVPYAQSNAVMSRELQALKSQMQELKNMMRMSFDLQLDIQRAIRQEVAAAVSSAISGTSGPVAASSPVSQPVNENKCLICLGKDADSVLYQCGHLCCCYTCGMELKSRSAHCPVCRAPIRDIIRAYKC